MTNETQKTMLAALIRDLHTQGKSPATSTNYSFLGTKKEIFVSRSGVDKAQFSPEDFIEVDIKGQPLAQFTGIKPSAETLIHCFLYRTFAEVGCVLHSHSVVATILSSYFLKQAQMTFSGYEVIKGIHGQHTHETTIHLPIFDNEQNMVSLCDKLNARQAELGNYGFLIAKHGLYAWGKDIAAAKRHLEVWEFMLECELQLLQIR